MRLDDFNVSSIKTAIDYIYGEAAKWLYSLMVLKRAAVAGSNITNIIL